MKLSWIGGLIEPIARGMCKRMQGYKYSILGPFGIGARTSIHFSKGDSPAKSITFEPGQLPELRVVDFRTNTKSFAPGSMGEINGFNFPCVQVPDNASIQWFIDWMDKNNI
jgi:hypothetical protein